MFKIYHFQETLQTLKEHKGRNILTGFGVAWGIFILILLLSAGEGLQSGISRIFSGYAQNSMWLYGGQSSIIQEGSVEGKPIVFSKTLLDNITARFKEIECISPEVTNPKNSFISFKDKSYVAPIKGVGSSYFNIKLLQLADGRLFNLLDEKTERPVCIIGDNMKEVLFKNENPLGNYINISGNWFKVIGILSKGSMFSENEQRSVFISYNCFQKHFSGGLEFNVFGILLKNNTNTEIFERKLKNYLSRSLDFDKLDNKALYILNFNEQVKVFNKLFTGIKIFLWFIGICLLLSGIVGIGNMMLVIVKERTKEIGIRKAIGATPNEILMMILMESVVITTLSGLGGMLIGFGLVGIINWIIHSFNNKKDSLIDSLNINIPMALGALVILILSGCIAGFIPAKKATEIMPLEALNKEF